MGSRADCSSIQAHLLQLSPTLFSNRSASPLSRRRYRRVSPTGTTQRVSAAQINDLKIGDFKVPPSKFGVAALPRFALRQGGTKIGGILVMDTLYICHAIIDLAGMNLFLK